MGERLAIAKGVTADGLDACRHTECFDFSTSVEGPYTDICDALRDNDSTQCGTSVESAFPDGLDAFGQYDLLQAGTEGEGIIIDCLETGKELKFVETHHLGIFREGIAEAADRGRLILAQFTIAIGIPIGDTDRFDIAVLERDERLIGGIGPNTVEASCQERHSQQSILFHRHESDICI